MKERTKENEWIKYNDVFGTIHICQRCGAEMYGSFYWNKKKKLFYCSKCFYETQSFSNR